MTTRYLSQLRKDNFIFVLQEDVLTSKKSLIRLSFNHMVHDGRIKVSASKYLDPNKVGKYEITMGRNGVIIFDENEETNEDDSYITCEEINGYNCFLLLQNTLVHIQDKEMEPLELLSEDNISDYVVRMFDNKTPDFFKEETPEKMEEKLDENLTEGETKLEEELEATLEAIKTGNTEGIDSMAENMKQDLEIDHTLENFKFLNEDKE